jgi:hypothetical protein
MHKGNRDIALPGESPIRSGWFNLTLKAVEAAGVAGCAEDRHQRAS